MPSSRRWGPTLFAVALAAFGLLLVAAPLLSSGTAADNGMPLLVVPGIALIGTGAAILLFTAPSSPGRGAELVEIEGEPAVRVRLRPNVPAANLIVGSVFSLLFGASMVGIGLSDGGLLLLPLLALFLAIVPDALRALLRRPALLLTQRAVALRGWGMDARLAWEDVTGVELVVPHPRRPALRIAGHPGAASWSLRMRRIIVPLDLRPGSEHIDVRLLALDHPGMVQTLVEHLATLTEPDRRALLNENAIAFLTDQLRRPV